MDLTPHVIAGVIDLFGGLTREELHRAIDELAFKQGTSIDEATVQSVLETASDEFIVVEIEGEAEADAGIDAEPILVPGPAAFPQIPEDGPDLPHILDIPRRSIDRGPVAESIKETLRAELENDPGPERVDMILEVSYDLETWGSIDADSIRSEIADGDGE